MKGERVRAAPLCATPVRAARDKPKMLATLKSALRKVFVAAMFLGIAPVRAQFRAESIEGWSVGVDRSMDENAAALTSQVRAVLRENLRELSRRLPAKRVEELRRVPLFVWIGNGPKHGAYYSNGNGFGDGRAPPAAIIGGIAIDDPQSVIRWLEAVPSGLLHELAHAYHEQVLGIDDPAIAAAYQNAVDHHLYENVANRNGQIVARSYALTNKSEYFALVTQAYYWKSGFYPFVNSELRGYDPAGYDLVRAKWEDRAGPQPLRRISLSEVQSNCDPARAPEAAPSSTRAVITVRNRTTQPLSMRGHRSGEKVVDFAGVAAAGYSTRLTNENEIWEFDAGADRCIAMVRIDAQGDYVEIVP
jgi:hypothetical protein